MKKVSFLDVIVLLFATLFLYAAISKLIEFDLFRAQIGKSPLITRYADVLWWMVPAVEILVAAMLIIPRLLLAGLYASFTLMAAFSAYIGFVLVFSPYVPCSCGGILDSLGWVEHLIFNLVFTLLAVTGIAIKSKHIRTASVFGDHNQSLI